MESILGNLKDNEYTILCEILACPDITAADLFFDFPTIDGYVEELDKKRFITDSDGILNITELGRTALLEYELQKNISKKRHSRTLFVFGFPTLFLYLHLFFH